MIKNKASLRPPFLFAIKFLVLFASLYGFYIFYLSLTSPGGKFYSAFLSVNLNFISWLRYFLIEASAGILNLLGYQTKTSVNEMLVVRHNIIHVGYDCLGFGIMSFFTAFVFTYPGKFKIRMYFYISGLLCIQLFNLARFILLALYWKHTNVYISDHHTIYNLATYLLIGAGIYFYTRYQDSLYETNKFSQL